MRGFDAERLSHLVLDEFKRMHERFDGVDAQFVDLHHELRAIRRQVGELEKATKNFAGFAKEIDHLLGRVAAIEKHLGLHSGIVI